MNQIQNVLNKQTINQPDIQFAIQRVMCGLRGFTIGCATRKVFILFLEWLQPYHPFLIEIIQLTLVGKVAYSVLRLYNEISQNKAQVTFSLISNH